MTFTAKSETGASWAARMDNITLRNWTASQLYDFSSILTSGYFNYGRYANGMDFSNIGAQTGLFNQFGTDGYADSLDLYNVNSYHYTGLDPAAVDPSSSYAGNNPANGNLPNRDQFLQWHRPLSRCHQLSHRQHEAPAGRHVLHAEQFANCPNFHPLYRYR